jgi:hypothetical protein
MVNFYNYPNWASVIYKKAWYKTAETLIFVRKNVPLAVKSTRLEKGRGGWEGLVL